MSTRNELSSTRPQSSNKSSTASRRTWRKEKTDVEKSVKQESSKSSKSLKSSRLIKKTDKVDKTSSKKVDESSRSSKSIRKKQVGLSVGRSIPEALSPKSPRHKLSTRNEDASTRSRKRPAISANSSLRQPRLFARQSLPQRPNLHPQSTAANKLLQPSDKEMRYVEKLIQSKNASTSSIGLHSKSKSHAKSRVTFGKKKKKDESSKSQKKSKVEKPKVVKAKEESAKILRSPTKPQITTPKSNPKSPKPNPKSPRPNPKSPKIAAEKATLPKTPVEPSSATTSPRTSPFISCQASSSRHYLYTKDEDLGSLNQSGKEKKKTNSADEPDKKSLGQSKNWSTKTKTETEHSINCDEVLKNEREAEQIQNDVKPTKAPKQTKVAVVPSALPFIGPEDAERIAKLRANAPKPKPQPKNPKEMNDVISDWESVDIKTEQKQEKKLPSSPAIPPK
ncbi:hypothetical protein M3Y98_00917500 [Aphelenchoides besseyi]|nr:hypothetical protein M3Y98_00917500 [Aphelenchoides besseyi]